jgi:cation/acetate symporter
MLIGLFYLVTFVLGFGASVLVGRGAITAVDKGGNMAAPLLAEVLGGTGFLGFISAVAFATILAVVAGLTLSGAAALSHDLYTHVVKRGQVNEYELMRVARIATTLLAVLAIALGIVFKGQNVAFMVGLAFAIAASANFPALILSMTFKRFTTRGAVASMLTGTVSSLLLIVLSPTVMVDIFHAEAALFPLKNPGAITVPLSFFVGIVVSLLSPEPEAQRKFAEAEARMHLGGSAEPPVAAVPAPVSEPAAAGGKPAVAH